MKSNELADAFEKLGITASYSRPHVSNDNAFSEAHFKTLKYHHTYPGRFESLQDARDYFETFFTWYNHEHHHSGLALYTPAAVHTGDHVRLWKIRQDALDAHYAQHPERYVKGPPQAKRMFAAVYINPDEGVDVRALLTGAEKTERMPAKAG